MKQQKQKFVPLEKQSKRKRKGYYASRRKTWGELNPVTRSTPNPRAYNRNKSRQRYDHEPPPGFFYLSDSYLYNFIIRLRNHRQYWRQ
ncbi:MAG: hypothetical protein FWD71_12600 [Oscillospiraceae bacterium]|nr:hypothetical protein [Oscillospiraceae bacterium]